MYCSVTVVQAYGRVLKCDMTFVMPRGLFKTNVRVCAHLAIQILVVTVLRS
jgi:hypothetical protein